METQKQKKIFWLLEKITLACLYIFNLHIPLTLSLMLLYLRVIFFEMYRRRDRRDNA